VTDQNLIQFYRVQLSQAACAYEAERDLRLQIERSTVQYRVVLFELAQRWVPCQLDDLWKATDVNAMPTDQFMRWLKSQVDAQLFEYRALCNGRHTERIATLKATLAERETAIQERDRQINDLHDQLKQLATLKDQNDQLQVKLAQAEQAQADLAADLQTSRAMVSRLKAELSAARSTPLDRSSSPIASSSPNRAQPTLTNEPPSNNTNPSPAVAQPLEATTAPGPIGLAIDYPASSESTPSWYAEWLASTKPEERDRQAAAVQSIGQGAAFLRAEVIEQLNALGLIHEVDPDRPSGAGGAVFRKMIDHVLIQEVDGGLGPAVPMILQLTDRGRQLYELLFGSTLESDVFEQLFKRHKTIEHTALNILARRMLHRFGCSQIELFPDQIRLPSGLLADPDVLATDADGQLFYLECERGSLVRTAEERAAKWNRMIELGRGRLHLFVPNKQARGHLMAELTDWIHSDAAAVKRAQVLVCEYTKALNAPGLWTYTTDLYQ
jgi:hypothetical protein